MPLPSSPSPIPAQPGSVASESAASGPPKVPGSDRSYQARIDEIYGQANYYKRELAQAKERLARLEGRAEATPPPAPTPSTRAPKSFTDMEDGQLDDAWNYASSDETKNPQLLNQILEEKVRRRVEAGYQKALTDGQKQIEKAQLLRDTNARILQDFGADAFDQESTLYQAAAEEMDEFLRLYGPDRVKSLPTLRYDAFLRAVHKTKTPADRERLEQLEAENQALHQRASVLERGGVIGAAPKPSDEALDALKTGGPKAAIRRLRLTQSLVQDVQRRAVIPGR